MNVKLVLGALAVAGMAVFSLPASAHHHHRWHHHGGYGLDVAPGGGHYTKRDIINESTLRMSHPHVGEPCAPSVVARRPHRYINRVEMVMTANLNLEQVHHHRWKHHR